MKKELTLVLSLAVTLLAVVFMSATLYGFFAIGKDSCLLQAIAGGAVIIPCLISMWEEERRT